MAKANTMGATENDPILRRLQGRIDWLLRMGRVKDPELMQSALEYLSDLIDATEQLLNDMAEPDDSAEAMLMARCRQAIARARGAPTVNRMLGEC